MTGPSDDDLLSVARHGSNELTQALALAILARRHDRTDELLSMTNTDDEELAVA